MEAKIELNDEQFQEVMQAALLSKIDDIGRDRIVAQAIKYLTTPEGGESGKNEESPLMKSFNRELGIVLNGIVREEVNKKGSIFREKIEELVGAGVKEWLGKVTNFEGNDSLPSQIAAAIEKALIPKGSYY